MGAGEARTGERVGHVDHNIEVTFVVFPDTVVGWFKFTNKLGFEHK